MTIIKNILKNPKFKSCNTCNCFNLLRNYILDKTLSDSEKIERMKLVYCFNDKKDNDYISPYISSYKKDTPQIYLVPLVNWVKKNIRFLE